MRSASGLTHVAGLGLPAYDERSAVAMVATSAQLRVKGVEHVGSGTIADVRTTIGTMAELK
jgi:hypothetical protein